MIKKAQKSKKEREKCMKTPDHTQHTHIYTLLERNMWSSFSFRYVHTFSETVSLNLNQSQFLIRNIGTLYTYICTASIHHFFHFVANCTATLNRDTSQVRRQLYYIEIGINQVCTLSTLILYATPKKKWSSASVWLSFIHL